MINRHQQFRIATLGAILLILATFAYGLTSTILAQADSRVVAVMPAFPLALESEEGEPSGFAIELMNAIAERADIQVTHTMISLPYLIPSVVTHLYDIGSGCIFITAEREAQVNFSKPYFATGLVLVVQAQDSTVQQPSDLTEEMTVGVVPGSEGESLARTQTKAVVILIASLEESFAQVEAGTLNAVLASESALFDYQRTNLEAKLKTVGGLLTYNECGFAVPKDDTELLATLDTALAQIKEDGGYEELYHKWFGQRPVPEKPLAPTEATPEPSSTPIVQPLDPAASTAIVSDTGSPVETTGVDLGSISPYGLFRAELAGIYYLSLQSEASLAPSLSGGQTGGAYYQIVTLAENGLWFAGPTMPPSISPANDIEQAGTTNGQPGLWRLNDEQQVEATLLSFGTGLGATTGATSNALTATTQGAHLPDDGRAGEVLRKQYRMIIAADGSVIGSYTVAAYVAADFAQLVEATPIMTQTMTFTGRRVR